MSKKLLEWKNDTEKTPLILYGARQDRLRRKDYS